MGAVVEWIDGLVVAAYLPVPAAICPRVKRAARPTNGTGSIVTRAGVKTTSKEAGRVSRNHQDVLPGCSRAAAAVAHPVPKRLSHPKCKLRSSPNFRSFSQERC